MELVGIEYLVRGKSRKYEMHDLERVSYNKIPFDLPLVVVVLVQLM
jgi:hypothetical protein